ncbi:iron-regulated protein [Rufibacter radiotolerans]|uniref:Iron-regulated protein n=2 Tax=Rufibacter radiotolerans TaxID=1379910 RepID=A0A0H4VQ56_9BACT|nr:iron-regulated protein [Rufibacter radiotolerans]
MTVLFLCSFTMDKPAYRLFSGKGKSVKYKKVLKELAAADVVFFGEQHNDPIAHWLELELAKDLYQIHGKNLVIGMEMWEADTQSEIDSFLMGQLEEAVFMERSRVWPNYTTDYRPVLLFAKENGLKVIATNVPRRHARTVARESLNSLDTLSQQEKAWLAPLPIMVDMELPGYKRMRSMFGDTHGASAASSKMIEAQALKDATMAHYIHQNLQPGQHLLHLNGSYHSDHQEGIIWYLRKLRPESKLKTITTVAQPSLEDLGKDHLQRADVVLVVPETMTKTY